MTDTIISRAMSVIAALFFAAMLINASVSLPA